MSPFSPGDTTDMTTAVLHHSERWQDPLTGKGAIITQWRGQTALVKMGQNEIKRDTLEACQLYLTEAGFVRCKSL